MLSIVTKTLDYYVGILAAIAEGDDHRRRTNPFTPYGKMSDYRADHRTIEYRVPGGALLRHPKITHGLISLCSLVIHDVLERLRIYTKDYTVPITEDPVGIVHELYPGIKTDSATMLSIMSAHNLDLARKESVKIQDDLSSMINYAKYHESIIDFINLYQVNMSSNLCDNWLLH